MITIHCVFHAHLDPIWMWPWTSGLDEAIATARSACDRLDRHPDLFYTQGEAWSFHLIEQADPALFARIKAHVVRGQWEIVNGWWTQPDCNLPSALGLRRQISIGLDYVKDRFGLSPRCGFNPDSFGHCAHLPEILRDCGQDRYVFMRPQDHECDLPGRLFRWSAQPGGREVTALRLGGGYNNGGWLDNVRPALTHMPPGAEHALSLFGLGDHGGGPTEKTIAWVREQANAIPGARLVFSTIDRFFAAIDAQKLAIPQVHGELQFHAIGCYTVVRAIKTGIRRAEHQLASAESLAGPADTPTLTEAWRKVCSHQFHDSLGGTGLPSTYPFVLDEIGGAAAAADTLSHFAMRRRMGALPEDSQPRMVLMNANHRPLGGWHDIETYLEGRWRGTWRLMDEQGTEVPYQVLAPEAITDSRWGWCKRRVLVRREIPAMGMRVLRQDLDQPPAVIPPQVTVEGALLRNQRGIAVDCGGSLTRLLHQQRVISTPTLLLIEDGSDTWSHGIDRYGDGGETPRWDQPIVIDEGPLMASIRHCGRIGESRLVSEWRVYADEPWVELLLEVHWSERHQVLKLQLPFPSGSAAASRTDGVTGRGLVRANDGIERPLGEWTDVAGLGVVCPDVFALDASPQRARLTLLRSPLMAHHVPHPGSPVRPVWSDQGVHRFRFRFVLAGSTPELLAEMADAWQRPALFADLTRGMGPRDS